MAENAGFLSLSFLKKERETVLITFSPKLQKVAENTNNLHGCWILHVHEIFPMLLLEKYKKLFHSLNHIFTIQKETVKIWDSYRACKMPPCYSSLKGTGHQKSWRGSVFTFFPGL